MVMREGEDREAEGDADTMFYITLTIEEDRPGGVTLVPGHGSQDSDVDSNTYSHMSSDSSGSRLVTRRTGRSVQDSDWSIMVAYDWSEIINGDL